MSSLGSCLLVLVAPLPYWMLGLPWVIRSNRFRLAPLIGCALAGLFAEWAMMAHLPVRGAVAMVALLSAIIAMFRGRPLRLVEVRDDLLAWLPCYCVSVLAVSLAPFPVVGSWSGDWFINLRMGEALVDGNLPREMLTRPPLFPAAAAPLWLFDRGLIPLQIFMAVASASVLMATHHLIQWLRPGASRAWLLPLVLSPFFLHDTTALWAKLLAGAFIILAMMEALQSARLVSASFFALAIASHEGFIIWLPLVLVCHARGPRRWRGALEAIPIMAVAGLLLAGPMVIWVVSRYGFGARIAVNPVVTTRNMMADSAPPASLRIILSVVTAFVGWAPLEEIAAWAHRPHPLSAVVVAKEIYWVVTAWISTLAGTLVGFLFPFWIVRREIMAGTRPSVLPEIDVSMMLALSIAVILNGALPGIYCSWGMMQAALSPLALGAYALLVARVASPDAAGWRSLKRVANVMGIAGTAPWLLANVGTAIGLWLSAGFRARFGTSSESDYLLALDNHLTPLGMAAFPAVPLLCFALLTAFLLFTKRGGQQRSGDAA